MITACNILDINFTYIIFFKPSSQFWNFVLPSTQKKFPRQLYHRLLILLRCLKNIYIPFRKIPRNTLLELEEKKKSRWWWQYFPLNQCPSDHSSMSLIPLLKSGCQNKKQQGHNSKLLCVSMCILCVSVDGCLPRWISPDISAKQQDNRSTMSGTGWKWGSQPVWCFHRNHSQY